MAKGILMDEFHVNVLAPQRLTPLEYDAIRQTLDDARFHTLLKHAVKRVVGRFPALSKTRITITQ